MRTHPPTAIQGFRADAHGLTRKKLLVCGARSHPPTHTHLATVQGFFADTLRLTVKAILSLIMLEYRKNERTVNNAVT